MDLVGTSKALGIIAVGTNLPVLDATRARVTWIEPSRISLLRLASSTGSFRVATETASLPSLRRPSQTKM